MQLASLWILSLLCFFPQFNPERRSLEVTTDPCVTGTVELLAMITEPKVSSEPQPHLRSQVSLV